MRSSYPPQMCTASLTSNKFCNCVEDPSTEPESEPVAHPAVPELEEAWTKQKCRVPRSHLRGSVAAPIADAFHFDIN